MKFQIKGLDNVKLSQNARFCIESINTPILYNQNNTTKSLGQTIIRMSNLSSINCFDTHGNGQTDPVIFTAETQTKQQRLGTTGTNAAYKNTEQHKFFIIHTPKCYIIFQYQVIF